MKKSARISEKLVSPGLSCLQVANNNNNNGITQAAFPQSGSSSTWGTNDFTSLSKDGAAKEDHLNIQSHGQAGNRTRDLRAPVNTNLISNH